MSKGCRINNHVLNQGNTVNTGRLFEAVATEFNQDDLQTGSGCIHVLVTKHTVKFVLKRTVKLTSSSTSSRRAKEVEPKSVKWPLSVDQLLGGCLTYKEAIKYCESRL